MIPLGTAEKPTKVRDKLTDLEGTVLARAEYLYGCVWISVLPKKLHDGKPLAEIWVDEPRLEVIVEKEKKIKKVIKKEKYKETFHRYGPSPSPPSRGPSLRPEKTDG